MVTSRAYLEDARMGEGLAAVRAEVGRLMQGFMANGAGAVEPGALLPADVFIDLYGEDLRARAYTTHDPVLGERMLRPDFTVPVVQLHMASGGAAARYAYAGSVWRKQEPGSNRPSEYLQVGFEVIGGDDAAADDAEVFAVLAAALGDLPVEPVTGDMGLVLAAIDALDTNDRRKAALRRHVWRPERFKRLLKRYSAPLAMTEARKAMFDALENDSFDDLIAKNGPVHGMRSPDEVRARAEVLWAETRSEPISTADIATITRVLDIKEPMSGAAQALREAAPQLSGAADRLEARADALAERGLDVSQLAFEASYGRTTLEYYDGFVFGFRAPERPDLPQIAQGGRYDALTRVLGNGAGLQAVGGIVRPEALLSLRKGGAV